ncbi:hypothetical protein [Paenibacillus sp. FSL R7-0652]|jgi:hypothetical protein
MTRVLANVQRSAGDEINSEEAKRSPLSLHFYLVKGDEEMERQQRSKE